MKSDESEIWLNSYGGTYTVGIRVGKVSVRGPPTGTGFQFYNLID